MVMIIRNGLVSFFLTLTVVGICNATDVLVDIDWVNQNLGEPKVVFLDVTSNINAYKNGHIPGAIFTHYKKDKWRVSRKIRGKKVPGLLPSPEHLSQLIGRLGIKNSDHVVLIPSGRSPADVGIATRIYWTLKVVGHKKLSILNGGMAAYKADKWNKLEKGIQSRDPVAYEVQVNYDYLAREQDVLAAIQSGDQLIDSRTKSQFLGFNQSGRTHRAGTLPGAVNVPAEWATVNGGGFIRDFKALGKLYALVGVAATNSAIIFCNTGHWASLGWFLHSEVLGNKKSKMYDGSMAEYTTDAAADLVVRASFD